MDQYHKVAPENEAPTTEIASSSNRARTRGRERDRKGEGKGKIYGPAAPQTWEQTNRYARDWRPPAMNSYGATFNDGVWTKPRFRRDPGHWDAPYYGPNMKTTRRSWRKWDQDHEQDQEEEDDTWQEQG